MNEFLEEYKPFYATRGEPLPWTITLSGTTYYEISEESIQLLFKEVKEKVSRTVTILCGLHLNHSSFENEFLSPSSQSEKQQKRNDKQIETMLVDEIKKTNEGPAMEETSLKLFLDMFDSIEE